MRTLIHEPLRYAPPLDPATSSVEVGRAFRRLWHEPSPEGHSRLQRALAVFVGRLHSAGASPEASVLAFKQAIVSFGGVHAVPSLAEARHADGDDCAATYASAFGEFVAAYFDPAISAAEASIE